MTHTLTRVTSQTISIGPVEPNGPECKQVSAELHEWLRPFTTDLEGPQFGGTDGNRPSIMPEGSIFLVAELSSFSKDAIELDFQYCGGIGLMPLQPGLARSKGLSQGEKVGEVKRAIVTEKFRGKGIGSKLLGAIEEAARTQEYTCLVVETLRKLPRAQHFYESHGFQPRDVYGTYSEDDSVCYEKWLK